MKKKIISTSIRFRVKIAETHIVSLFAEKSHRSPSDLETRIAHRCLKLKDTVTLGFVGHKSNLTGRERLAPQSKNLFSDREKDKKLVK